MSKGVSNRYSIDLSAIDRDNLYVNETKLHSLTKDIDKQLNTIVLSLNNISVNINKLINQKVFKGNKAETMKGLSKKAKSQSGAADKLRKDLCDKVNEDIQYYPIKILDDRISELERKINMITKE